MQRRTEHLNRKELNTFKKVLLERRKELLDEALKKDENDDPIAVRGSMSNFPIHLADLASDSFEQDMRMRMMEQNEKELLEIDAALERMDKGNYGICEFTGKPIEKKRLKIIPWTRFSLEGQETMERDGAPIRTNIKPVWREPVSNEPESEEEAETQQ